MLMCRPLHSNYRCYTVERCRMKTLFFFFFLLLNEIPRFLSRKKKEGAAKEKKEKIVGATIKRNNREKVYRYID